MQKPDRLLRRQVISWTIWCTKLIGLAVLTVICLSQPGLAASCGPGPGWVSQCQPSVNILPTTTVLDVTVNSPNGPVRFSNLLLTGLITTQTGTPGVDSEGRAFFSLDFSRSISAILPND